LVRSTLGFDGKGQLVSCEMETTGLAIAPQDCELVEKALQSQPGRRPNEAQARNFAISEVYFYPVPPTPAHEPPKLSGAIEVAQQVSRVVVAPEGEIISCEGVSYSGSASPQTDACSMIRVNHFNAGSAGSEPLTGTLITRGYVRSRTVT
jgi:hypothetical protein